MNKLILLLACTILVSCSAGTLGRFPTQWQFLTTENNLLATMDSVFSNRPEYKVPEKWMQYNDWSKRGYDFLKSRVFYFNTVPEEMYYVTIIGSRSNPNDTNIIRIAIRAIHQKDGKWLKSDEIDSKEAIRIEARFETEIVPELEQYIKK